MAAHLIVIDVGNTATSVGLFQLPASVPNPKPAHVWTVGTREILRSNCFSHFLKNKIKSMAVAGAIVSSVVPEVDAPLKKELAKVLLMNIPFVSSKTPSRVKVRYSHPAEVGADRIVNARAAMALWKGPSIVIDFGTATTFDCVTAGGSYLGGVIAPGPVISAEALYNRTAKLPMVMLKGPVRILGRNTLESIQAGLYHGYRGLVKEITLRLRKQMGSGTCVMATGGQAHWILKGVSEVDRHVPHLTLLGLYYMWLDGQKIGQK